MRLVYILFSLLLIPCAHASLVQFDNRASFETEGTELYNEGFEGFTNFDAGGFNLIGFNNFELSGVTYLSSTFSNIIQAFDGVTSLNGHDPITNIYTNGIFQAVNASVDNDSQPVNQLGFNFAFVNRESRTRTSNSDFIFQLTSNVSTYTIDVFRESLIHVANGSIFFGFGFTDVNEYFTGFTISPATRNIPLDANEDVFLTVASGILDVSPTIDNVTLRTGQVSPPPPVTQSPLPTGLLAGAIADPDATSVPSPNTAGLLLALLGLIVIKRNKFHFNS